MKSLRKQHIYIGVAALVIIVLGGVGAYLIIAQKSVYIDTASIEAPLINLTAATPGRLDAIYVQPGDTVTANEPVAEVGSQVITSRVAGLVVQITNTIGAQVAQGDSVVEMIDPTQLRVVGRIDETKGLNKVMVGDPVTFTVDTFGSQKFSGVVDEVAPTSNQSDVVFNISDQREVQQFDIKARFDTATYTQLKNGMSARMTIYTASK